MRAAGLRLLLLWQKAFLESAVLAEAALLVMRVWAAGTLYLAVILLRRRPPLRLLTGYARGVLKAGFRVEQAAAGRRPAAVLSATGKAEESPFCGLKTAPPDLLTDNRIRRLQGRVIEALFLRVFGIRPGKGDARVMAWFSSSAWLCRNMAAAAGPATGSEDFRRRCRVVYPVFLQAMKIHRAWLTVGRVDKIRLHLIKRALGRYRGVGPRGEITGSLYPEIITRRQLQLAGETWEAEAAERRYRLRTAGRQALGECESRALILAALACPRDPEGVNKIWRALRRAEKNF